MNHHSRSFGQTLNLLACLLSLVAESRGQDITTSAPPAVAVLATDPFALAGTSSGAFTLIRSGSTNADLAVNLTISGTASNGLDYVAISNVVTIPAGSLATDI
ncbi:MAG: hypothetical protein HY300_06920, partial [Verrucomicrobia bacterium]|nr:hypothetical protein [Verrucomicrobiota bacterium]